MEFTENAFRLSLVVIVALSLLLVLARAARSGSHPRAGEDAKARVRNHPALAPETAAAILPGTVVPGMTLDEVRASTGQPAMPSIFEAVGGNEVVWLLPASHLRLGDRAAHKASMVRIVFQQGRVVAVRPVV